MSVRLYVGNLPEEVNRQELEAVFVPSEEVVSLKLITDRKTGKCRGFGFLTVASNEAAESFIEKFNGTAFKEQSLRVEKAQPKAKGDRSEGEGAEAGEPAQASAPTASPVAARPISTGGPRPRRDRQRGGERQGEGGGSRREGGRSERDRSYIADDAQQPDPRWADALRAIRKQLTKA
jgi:RNA recognition motif-containing protein